MQFSKKILILLVCAMFFGVSFTVHAYVYGGVKWAGTAVTVDYGSPTIPATWITPIASGSSAWNATASPFTFSAGTSNNDLTYSNKGTWGGKVALSTVTGVGTTINDVDLVFNSYYSWSTAGAAGKYDVQNTATHEFGHFLNLSDLTGAVNSEKTMYGTTTTGETKKRSLHSDDINGINYIYP